MSLFLTEIHILYHTSIQNLLYVNVASGEWGVKDTTALIPVIQNVWAPYLTMRHVLLESFVWEEAIHVPFLRREIS